MSRIKKKLSLSKRLAFLFEPRFRLFAGMGALLLIGGAAVLITIGQTNTMNKIKPPADDTRIGTDDEALRLYIEAYGAEKAIAFIKTLPVDCHQRVHKVGRLSYELQGNKAFTTLNSECMSGYTHGVTESFFNEHGTDNLAQNLELICQGQQIGFYAHQCLHGVGHGLMAYNDYDLPAALKGCDSLPKRGSNLESCYSGVFMENVVGAIAVDEAKTANNADEFHYSSWLSSDPLFPCNAVEAKYKSACYIFQTSRMIQIPDFNYQKVAAACSSIESEYQEVCFLSMGRDVSNSFGLSYAEIEKTCGYARAVNNRLSCIGGASQDKFWHESEQDEALSMCQALQEEAAKTNCYATIAARGREIIASSQNRQAFCAKFEPRYAQLCDF